MKRLFSLFAGLALMLNLASVAAAELVVDSEAPSDVENVSAVAGDGLIILAWDVATDDVGVVGYNVYVGIEAVDGEGETYTFDPFDVGDVVSAEISDLENDTTYYFAVTALDSAGNESENFSFEVSATPEAGLGGEEDEIAPTVVEAEAYSMIEVDIEFSEMVELPELNPEQAFSIEAEETLELLEVLDAEVLEDGDAPEGKEGMIVRLTTEEQIKDVNYILTATIDVTDPAGNPIVSGTSDTASFLGSDVAPEAGDEDGPVVESVEFVDYTHLMVNFDEAVVLGLNPAENFEVQKDGSSVLVEVLEVVLGENTKNGFDDASAILTVESLTAGDTYTATVTGISDEDVNMIGDDNSGSVVIPGEGAEGEGEGEGEGEVEGELVDPAQLLASSLKEVVNEGDVWNVLLSWTLPGESISVAQKLYMSVNGANYSDLASLSAADAEYTAEALAAGDYWFKLTQLDAEGNESEGLVASVNITETGPGVAGMILFSLGLGRYLNRRKKQ
ncbi:fibronectin type III domain-containing protein [Candidatus Peregrinibacteria bacterium]|nr:fibronectin type III domain-containing protein [Candidatus Peregrinibacteria bacterium]